MGDFHHWYLETGSPSQPPMIGVHQSLTRCLELLLAHQYLSVTCRNFPTPNLAKAQVRESVVWGVGGATPPLLSLQAQISTFISWVQCLKSLESESRPGACPLPSDHCSCLILLGFGFLIWKACRLEDKPAFLRQAPPDSKGVSISSVTVPDKWIDKKAACDVIWQLGCKEFEISQ